MAQLLRVTDPSITGTSFAGDLSGGIANVLDSAYKKKKFEAHEKQRNERLKVQDHVLDLRVEAGEWDLTQRQKKAREASFAEAGAEELDQIDPSYLKQALEESGDVMGPRRSTQLNLADQSGKPLDSAGGKAFAKVRSAMAKEERAAQKAIDAEAAKDIRSGETRVLTEKSINELPINGRAGLKIGDTIQSDEYVDRMEMITKPGATKSGWGQPWYNKETQSYMQTNERTGESKPAAGVASSDDGENVLDKKFGQDANSNPLTRQALFDSIQEADYSTASKVQGLLDGTFDPSSFETMRGGRKSNLFALMRRVEPGWNQADYGIRYETRKKFITGKQGDNVRSLNTAMGHAEDAIGLGEKLNNTMFTDWNKLKNNLISRTGYPQVTNFDKAIDALVAESATLFKGTAGTDQEIKEWRKNFNSSQSPEQIQEGIETLMHLFKSRMDAIANTYAQGMGREMQSDELLSDEMREVFNKYAPPEDQLPDPSGKSLIPYNPRFDELSRMEERKVVEGMKVQMEGQNRGVVDPSMMNPNLGGEAGGGAGDPGGLF